MLLLKDNNRTHPQQQHTRNDSALATTAPFNVGGKICRQKYTHLVLRIDVGTLRQQEASHIGVSRRRGPNQRSAPILQRECGVRHGRVR